MSCGGMNLPFFVSVKNRVWTPICLTHSAHGVLFWAICSVVYTGPSNNFWTLSLRDVGVFSLLVTLLCIDLCMRQYSSVQWPIPSQVSPSDFTLSAWQISCEETAIISLFSWVDMMMPRSPSPAPCWTEVTPRTLAPISGSIGRSDRTMLMSAGSTCQLTLSG